MLRHIILLLLLHFVFVVFCFGRFKRRKVCLMSKWHCVAWKTIAFVAFFASNRRAFVALSERKGLYWSVFGDQSKGGSVDDEMEMRSLLMKQKKIKHKSRCTAFGASSFHFVIWWQTLLLCSRHNFSLFLDNKTIKIEMKVLLWEIFITASPVGRLFWFFRLASVVCNYYFSFSCLLMCFNCRHKRRQ